MIFQMNGRIEFSEFYNGKYISLITTPAPDPYSQPSKFKVNSESQLGAIGQEVSLDVTVSGFVREKPYTDKQTGQRKIFHEDNVILRARLAQAKPQAVKAG